MDLDDAIQVTNKLIYFRHLTLLHREESEYELGLKPLCLTFISILKFPCILKEVLSGAQGAISKKIILPETSESEGEWNLNYICTLSFYLFIDNTTDIIEVAELITVRPPQPKVHIIYINNIYSKQKHLRLWKKFNIVLH